MTRNEVSEEEVLKVDHDIYKSSFIFDKSDEYTKTSLFLLPMVRMNISNIVVRKFFVDSFLDDKEHEHEYTRPIFILFAVEDFEDEEWKTLYKNIAYLDNYITDYDCGIKDGKNLVMIVLSTPLKEKENYYHFKAGRYSKFSDDYKSKISKTILDRSGSLIVNIAYEVVTKSKKLMNKLEQEFGYNETGLKDICYKGYFSKLDEIWDIPRKEKEYYRFKKEIHESAQEI